MKAKCVKTCFAGCPARLYEAGREYEGVDPKAPWAKFFAFPEPPKPAEKKPEAPKGKKPDDEFLK